MRMRTIRLYLSAFALASGAVLAPGCGGDDDKDPTPATCKPGCDGAMLTYCDEQSRPVVLDCAADIGADGVPATCQFLEDLEDYYCVGDYDEGCGDETLEGRCDGSTLIWCRSESGGDATGIENFDCASSADGYTECAVAPDGVADCVVPGTTGCGYVPKEGACHDTTLTQCVMSAVETTDCAATGKKCGLASDGVTHACFDATIYKTGAGDADKEVSGTIVYEKKVVDTSSLANAEKGFAADFVLTPVRRALVQLLLSDGTEVQRTFTDETGAFSLYLPTVASEGYVRVSASADPEEQPLSVRDCPPSPEDEYPAGCTDGQGRAYQWESDPFTGPTALGEVALTEASGLAGAFNIFNLMLKGQDFARENLNHGMAPSTPPVVVQWKKGFETITSYFAGDKLVIQGVASDTDEFDDPVLMHEFGHFLQAAFSESDSPGGDHDGSPTDPRLAFGEGYGTYVGCRIAGSSLYFDTKASGISITDINNTGVKAESDSPMGIKQLMSEYAVGEMLWRIDLGTGGDTTGEGAVDGQGSGPVFDVLGSYLVNNSQYNDDHGVPGRDLVKFLDGWFCRDFGSQADASTSILRKVVLEDHGFPYDDFDHTIAPIGSCP
jgi:hypothetical protein